MNINDLTVYVRDKDLRRVGVLTGADLADFAFTPTVSSVGVWKIALPAYARAHGSGELVPHRMCEALRAPGAGIVVEYGEQTIFSGITEEPTETISAEYPTGRWVITGASDDAIIADALAWPDPTKTDPTTASVSNDIQKGDAATLIASYIRRNIGETAPAERRAALAARISTEGVAPAGATVTKSPRFQNLLELCQEIGAAGGVWFRMLDVRGVLRLHVFSGRDLTRQIRWDVDTGSLDSLSAADTAPLCTRPLVAGQGEGTARTFVMPTTDESRAAEKQWGRRIEQFVDQRQTDDSSELVSKGLEALDAGSSTIEVSPSSQSLSGWLRTWDLGDLISVTTDTHADLTYPVTSVPITIGADGIQVSAVLGVPDEETRSQTTSSRISNLERNTSGSSRETGEIVAFGGVTPPQGWLKCDGQLVSRDDFPQLFAVLGTKYGAGDGKTTFAVPDLRERVPVGVADQSTEFGVLGARAGVKSLVLTTAQMPAHTHSASTASAGAHTHAAPGLGRFMTTDRTIMFSGRTAPSTTTTTAYVPAYGSTTSVDSEIATVSGGAHTHKVTVGSTGSGAAVSVLQPSLAVNFIIKT